MKTLREIQDTFKHVRPFLYDKYKIKELGIFGSYARGEEQLNSDIDILIDYTEAPDLFQMMELEDYLSGLIGIKVDVVTINGLRPRPKERILKETIFL